MIKQLITKAASAVVNLLVTLSLGILVPRLIGPENYGQFNYIISTFNFFYQLLLLSTSTAYIYFLSSGKYKQEFVNFCYAGYLLFCIALVAIFNIILVCANNSELIWTTDITEIRLAYGFFYSTLFMIIARLTEFCDSNNLTAKSEKVKLFFRFMLIMALLILSTLSTVDVDAYFVIQNISLFLTLIAISRVLKPNRSNLNIDIKIMKKVFYDVIVYIKPLLLFSLISSLYAYEGKYLLQKQYGSFEQGIFNFSLQFSLIPVALITTLMTIYMSTSARNYRDGNISELKSTHEYLSYVLFFVSCLFSFGIISYAEDIIVIAVGDVYLEAVDSLKILMLYSAIQSLGMVNGYTFHSTERNKQYGIINTTILLIPVILMPFFKELDSVMLSMIMLLTYFIRTMVQIYFNLRYLGTNYIRYYLTNVIILVLIIGYFDLLLYFDLSIYMSILITALILIILLSGIFKYRYRFINVS
ncbi:lipopolysaccharide biosynthesis protein [Vibrio lentus]